VVAEGAMSAADRWIDATTWALAPLVDPVTGAAMSAYMKGAAPYLGIKAPQRRTAQRAAWAGLPVLGPPELAAVVRGLWAMPEREYQYAACDLIGRHTRTLPAGFLDDPVESLLSDRPWWDTIDSLENVAITPIVARHPERVPLMWDWLESGDRWRIRAAIQHQRGLKERTDTGRLFAMCDRFAEDREFFIAKAIGWALRDVTRWDPVAVQSFVDDHPRLSAVARREAIRGLGRPARPSAG
jgi:3-methyladenine DNA glycosylase AlkD